MESNQQVFQLVEVLKELFAKPDLIDSQALCPSGDRQRDTVSSETSVAASVARLFFFGRPVAVTRFVAAIVVPPLDRMLGRRLWPHVGQKALEGIPSFADADASTAIVFPFNTAGIPAAFTNSDPGIPFRCSAFAVLEVAVRRADSLRPQNIDLCPLVSKAAAALCCTCTQGRCENCLLCATITAAQPTRSAVGLPRKIGSSRQHNKATKSTAHEILHGG